MKRSKGSSKLKYFVVFSFAMLLIMTAVVLILKTSTGLDYSVEYTVFCGVFGGEVLSCALIKIFKIRKEESNESENY